MIYYSVVLTCKTLWLYMCEGVPQTLLPYMYSDILPLFRLSNGAIYSTHMTQKVICNSAFVDYTVANFSVGILI